ncbi:MAG: lipid-A-disaccharide synthase [Candidatus Omnitrophica bacterium]|nr:lipid-A-disaccharide synthase [Candidatus Omnitrophota bacterium]
MEQQKNHLIIVAGEASGDAHAASLVKAIKYLDPHATFSGLGGKEMGSSGVELYADITKIAVIGFVEVLKHLSEFKRLFRLILDKTKETNAKAVILVDYPGFNLKLAQELKKTGIKVIYYISPQVWAWNEKRVELIKKIVDKMIVLFEFEKEFYAKKGLDVTCVGHPLVDEIKINKTRESIIEDLGLEKTKKTIALLPGSRQKEITSLLPVMIRAAKNLYQKNQNLQFLILKAPTITDDLLNKYLLKKFPIKILSNQSYDGIRASDFCLVASGTATLEVAILNKPMVVVYKTSFLTWILAKLLIKIPYIGLVNVVAQKKIVPECIQLNATEIKITSEIISILSDLVKIESIKKDLTKVKNALGAPGASMRAAKEILSFLK